MARILIGLMERINELKFLTQGYPQNFQNCLTSKYLIYFIYVKYLDIYLLQNVLWRSIVEQ